MSPLCAENKPLASAVHRTLTYFDDHGNPQLASDLRIAKRKRDRALLTWSDWLLNWLSYLIADYGENFWLSLSYLAVIYAIGLWVFWDAKNMEPADPASPPPSYNRYWYTLGLLLPVVDIGGIKQWRPKPAYPLAWYANVHVLLGWAFIPVLIAAGAGLLK